MVLTSRAMAAKRVLIDALSLGPGGGRSYVTNLLQELDRDQRGLSFTVLGIETAFQGVDGGRIPMSWVRLPQSPRQAQRPARLLYEQLALPFRARAFDLLYCLADVAPLFGRTPVVVLARNLNIYDRRWYDDRRTRTLAMLGQAAMARASRVVFPTRDAADQISALARVPQDRVRIVHYGVSAVDFDEPSRSSSHPPYLFLPAAIEKHKNIATLIRALPLCRDRRLEVWIAGESKLDPGHRRDLEALAANLGIAERVRFLGAVRYQEISRFYREAQALVFPSFIETFGHPLLEAMVMGIPVIASDIPAFREICQETALFFPAESPDALAACVDQLGAQPDAARERVRSARERARAFSWSRSVDALCRVFEEALRGS
jgi:glycosyltransferase involved in cell wall biosynthesis